MPLVKQIKKQFTIPLYGATLWLVVNDDITKKYKEFKMFDGKFDSERFWACCSYDGSGTFGLFFDTMAVSVGTIAHEIFHLAHRIMEWMSCNFDGTHHEQGAILIEYLTNLVYKELKLEVKIKK